MENNLKEEIVLASELQYQRELIMQLNGITEKILNVLRGALNEDCESIKEENCMLDTLRNSKSGLHKLEKNVNEIARKIIG